MTLIQSHIKIKIMPTSNLLIKNGTVVTMSDNFDIIQADILIKNNKIIKIEKNLHPQKDTEVIDATNQFVLPGLIQTHVHLCQTLFRGYADDLSLMDWLKNKIWPMEYYHTAESIKASAEIAILEMNRLGTTSILDMATTKHTSSLFESITNAKIRYWGGKCLMDYEKFCGPLYQTTKQNLDENESLIKKWHKQTDLINYALCPRFVVSCTEELLQECAQLQKKYDLIIHTHASENLDEIEIVEKRTGMRNISYLNKLNLLNNKSAIAHCIHLDEKEMDEFNQAGAHVLHCPSSNLKLGSGVAKINQYITDGISVSIGADGAPCNNTLDPFLEMRLCALLQKPLFGSTALPAKKALELATVGGAKTLGMSHQLGRLKEGYLADIITVDRSHPSVATVENPYSALVYSCSGRDVTNTIINGELIVKNKKHKTLNESHVVKKAQLELNSMLIRIEQNK